MPKEIGKTVLVCVCFKVFMGNRSFKNNFLCFEPEDARFRYVNVDPDLHEVNVWMYNIGI
jgi:hypothetical protein